MSKIILLLGGARSGKSSFALHLAKQHPRRVVYVATAQALDHEMQQRITAHQQERPLNWLTIEAPLEVARGLQGLIQAGDLVILDCLTMLLSNLVMKAVPDVDQPDEAAVTALVESEMKELEAALRRAATDWIIVSNEVGLGLVPPYPVGRIYRDLLGWANQRLATLADEVYWLVAGIPVPIHSFRRSEGDSSPPAEETRNWTRPGIP